MIPERIKPEELRPVMALQDESSHWYVIPAEMHDEWYRLNAIMDDGEEGQVAFEKAEDRFIELFSQYMTGGGLNNIQLYANLNSK